MFVFCDRIYAKKTIENVQISLIPLKRLLSTLNVSLWDDVKNGTYMHLIFEFMKTESACKTFNLLIAEERKVAGIFFA